MSEHFPIYLLVASLSILGSMLLVGRSNIFDISKFSSWYYPLFAVTYLLRGAASQLVGDNAIFDYLGIPGFEHVWGEMTLAVSMAILMYGVGYRYGGKSRVPATVGRERYASITSMSPLLRSRLLAFAWLLIMWGYVSIILSFATGSSGGNLSPMGGQKHAAGIAENGTFWLMGANVYVSTGSVLLFLLTNNLIFSTFPAVPWVLQQVAGGWGRINVLGYFFSILAINLVLIRMGRGSHLGKRQKLALGGLGAVMLFYFLIIFPAARLENRGYWAGGITMDKIMRIVEYDLDPTMWYDISGDLCGFEPTVYFLTVDRSWWGSIYLYEYFLKPIPRMLWHGKPTLYTIGEEWFGCDLDPRYSEMGLTPGCVGMAFMQWGWLGIPLEFLLTGMIFRRLEESVEREGQDCCSLLAYSGFISLIPYMGRDSFFLQIAERWLFVYGIPVLVVWIIQKKSKGPIGHNRVGK